ncbi:hypothetical protein F4553_002779 [Allocatelliglobosispora scoriae]|uniref:Ig-like domain-containing protein n=1 Tax=Allocatelliglobosispora scoriae TaxID=643052 RepID=A0A841BRH4_9ACTN|nr:hypothetical protein [Allocatelliglobosispora scoriae]MBB5869400.1 hypothetical protein [Allocatelliglobosispora scoriae]
MRPSIKALIATAAITLGLLTVTPGTASAAPVPECSSGYSAFTCVATANTGQTTWTLTFYYATSGSPVTTQWRTPEAKVSSACYNPNQLIIVSYALSSGGGSSPAAWFYCNPGAWP